jgi:hypothetical protein
MYPFATPAELREHIKSTIEAMYLPSGGLAINIELGHEVPLENMEAILDAINEYRFFKG